MPPEPRVLSTLVCNYRSRYLCPCEATHNTVPRLSCDHCWLMTPVDGNFPNQLLRSQSVSRLLKIIDRQQNRFTQCCLNAIIARQPGQLTISAGPGQSFPSTDN